MRNPGAMPGRTVLVLNVSGIGDFVDSTPALAALRRRRPDDRIVLAVAEKTLPLARSCPYVDEVVGLPTRPGRGLPALADFPRWASTVLSWRKQFDLVLSLYGASSSRGRRFTRWLLAWIGAPTSAGRGALGFTVPDDDLPLDLVAAYLKLVSLVPNGAGRSVDDTVGEGQDLPRPELWIPEAALSEVETWLGEQPSLRERGGPRVVVALGGDRPSRRESPIRAERWLTSIQAEFDARVILWGASRDPGLPAGSRLAHADARGKWDLVHSAALISLADVVITTQSSAQHLVSVWDIPTVVLAGPADPGKHRPHLSRSPLRLIQRKVPCAPCDHHDCPLSGEDHQRCLSAIAPQDVLEAFRDVIEGAKGQAPAVSESRPRRGVERRSRRASG